MVLRAVGLLRSAQDLAVGGQHHPLLGDRAASRGGPCGGSAAAAEHPPVNTVSSAVTSTRPSSRRKVLACGGRPAAPSRSVTAAQSAIAAQESAPASTAPSAR